jgi:hypothetical protein
MKKIIILLLGFIATSKTFAQYFEATITKQANFLIFSVMPKASGGNIVISNGKQFSNIEFCVRYSNSSASFTWGTPIASGAFPGANFQFRGNNEFGEYTGRTVARFQWLTDGLTFVPNTVTADPGTNVTYVAGTVYEVFRVALNGTPPATVDMELIHNNNFSPAYIAITDRTNTPLDVSAASAGANAFFGPGFNVSGDDQILPLSQVPLPVKFLDFTATKNNNSALLSWLVENEDVNTALYEVEISTTGADFRKAATLQPLNNGRSSNSYSFTQDNLSGIRNNGIIYFRIKQIDKDGKFVYSDIRNVRISGRGIVFGVYPNPVKQSATVSFDLENSEKISFVLTDATGKQVWGNQLQGVKGANFTSINMAKFAAGTYNLKLQTATESKVIAVVKAD